MIIRTMPFRIDLLSVAMLCIMTMYIWLAPFNKVEESFNTQAIHDLLYIPEWWKTGWQWDKSQWTGENIVSLLRSWPQPSSSHEFEQDADAIITDSFATYDQGIKSFDHIQFRGVVPRTFILPLVIYLVAKPWVWLLSLPRYYAMYLARFCLGFINVLGFHWIRTFAEHCFGRNIGIWYSVITCCCQFHLLFYCSRTLPNIFALTLSNAFVALRIQCLFGDRAVHAVTDRKSSASGSVSSMASCMYLSYGFLSVAIALLRCELMLLLISCLSMDLLVLRMWKNNIRGFVIVCIVCFSTALCTALVSIAVDSYFWQQPSYPEFQVFFFNVIQNKSSAWGVSAWHWYYTSALPRSMLIALPLCLLGMVLDRRLAVLCLPFFGFIVLYSKLPHKELRFIIYAIPVFNLAAACCIERFRIGARQGKKIYVALFAGSVLGLISSSMVSIVFLTASVYNYPGGYAMLALRNQMRLGKDSLHNETNRVHIDVDAAMSGVSRFLEFHEDFSPTPILYSKLEVAPFAADVGSACKLNLEDHEECAITNRLRFLSKFHDHFDYLVTSNPCVPGYRAIMAQYAFSRLNINRLLSRLRSQFPSALKVVSPRLSIVDDPSILRSDMYECDGLVYKLKDQYARMYILDLIELSPSLYILRNERERRE